MSKVIANSQGKVLTQGGKTFLANEGGGTPTQHELVILSSGSGYEPEQTALARLELDGETPTISDLLNLDWRNTLVDAGYWGFQQGEGTIITHYHRYDDGQLYAVEMYGGCIVGGGVDVGNQWYVYITNEMDGESPLCKVVIVEP